MKSLEMCLITTFLKINLVKDSITLPVRYQICLFRGSRATSIYHMCSRPLNLTRNSGRNCGLYCNVSALTSYMSKTIGDFRPLYHKMPIDHILLGNTSPLKHTNTKARGDVTWHITNQMQDIFCYELFTYGQTDRTMSIKYSNVSFR